MINKYYVQVDKQGKEALPFATKELAEEFAISHPNSIFHTIVVDELTKEYDPEGLKMLEYAIQSHILNEK